MKKILQRDANVHLTVPDRARIAAAVAVKAGRKRGIKVNDSLDVLAILIDLHKFDPSLISTKFALDCLVGPKGKVESYRQMLWRETVKLFEQPKPVTQQAAG